jgi:hypothetical protein
MRCPWRACDGLLLADALHATAPQEHAGNDPSTVLVPATGTSTWGSRPDEAAAATDPAAITQVSTWASGPKAGQPGGPPVPPWAQGGPVPGPPPPQQQRGMQQRGLNPNEFPTLADGAKADVAVAKPKPDQAGVRRQRVLSARANS